MEDYNELIEVYKEIYYSRNNDFNILTSVHLSENDHTNVLCEILNMTIEGKKPFMESFVTNVLGIKDIKNYNSLIALTQISAIGSKKDSHGYIDLLIKDEGNTIFIVIENKVCDATDMPHQLDRYYFTLVQNKELLSHYDEEFREDCEQFWENRQDQHKEVYIVYLTKDGTKEPSEESINNKLKDVLKYKEISYKNNIFKWLQKDVFEVIKNEQNDAYKSIDLYIKELGNYLKSEQDRIDAYLNDSRIKNMLNEKLFSNSNADPEFRYNQYAEAYLEIRKKNKKLKKKHCDDLALDDLKRCLECYRDNVYGQYALEGWTIHRAPKWITFYPTRWMDKYGGNDNCNIHFGINWEKKNTKFDFAIQNKAGETYSERLRENEKNFYGVVKPIQEDYNWKKPRKGTDLSIKLDVQKMDLAWDIDNVDTTKEFFNNFAKNQSIINLINWIDDNLK